MDKLQWFKFTYSDWMMGKIMKCPEVTQARFIKLCCLYWNKETDLTCDDSIIEVDQEHYDILLSKKVIKVEGDNIVIEFLDEQYDQVMETSKKASIAGKASAAKRRAIAEQNANDRSTTVQRNPTDKIREEEIREEESVSFPLMKDFKCSDYNSTSDRGTTVSYTASRLHKGFVKLFPHNYDVLHATVKEWKIPVKELIVNRKYTPDQVFTIADFAMDHDFWKKIVLDSKSLTKNFEKIKEQYHAEADKKSN